MIEEKFNAEYFKIHYHIGNYKFYEKTYNDVVFRNEDSSGECQGAKEKCLRSCFTHFLGEDLTGTKSIAEHFVIDKRTQRHLITRCCCSQFEETNITHTVVTHKLTKLSFIVGKDCFKKLFWNADDIDTFFKETCNYCGEIVAKRAENRPNFCNQKCVRQYEEQEEKKRRLLREEAWKKKWGEQNNKKKVYDNCAECDKPKYTEKQRQFRFCFDCNQSFSMGSLSIS
jgi:hypothetical protein